jgi:Rieske Fe-S protein
MNRRQFVVISAAAAAACACAPELAAAAPGGTVDVGTADDFKSDGAVDKFAKTNRILVIRQGERLYATTATCTHRNCVIKPVAGDLRCPCHGSRFDLAGTVTRGPAKAPLPRYAISTDASGRIFVDTSQKFDQTQWEDPRSFVKLT